MAVSSQIPFPSGLGDSICRVLVSGTSVSRKDWGKVLLRSRYVPTSKKCPQNSSREEYPLISPASIFPDVLFLWMPLALDLLHSDGNYHQGENALAGKGRGMLCVVKISVWATPQMKKSACYYLNCELKTHWFKHFWGLTSKLTEIILASSDSE